MKRTWYDVSLVEIKVDCRNWPIIEEKKKTFWEFIKVFEVYLKKYASNTEITATSQFDVCGLNAAGIPYGNNITFNRPIALSTINKILKSIDDDGQFEIKKIEYSCESKDTSVLIRKLDKK